ncbi:hypothetical protein, conserved [Babesia ovata]|uniref:Uncharacterized protein n=1 Tax=Babesia ovata TaxID=189622 RepID=A0A2H6KGA3_9APIC|nr:uncharacterized protein BOVATA_035230 [Babesia ovata]GBE62030.1 hypothetical protein, conserved [Babesia ovata]
MIYNSLTDAPHNLKECIDWLIALRGTDGESNFQAMGEAVHKFLVDKPVGLTKLPGLDKVKDISREFIGQRVLRAEPFVEDLLKRFNEPMNKQKTEYYSSNFGKFDESNYTNVVKSRGVTAEEIAEKLAKVTADCEKFLDRLRRPSVYLPSYSSEATWESSCAKDPEACAIVLVGVAPMLYTGLRTLKEESNAEALRWKRPNKKNVTLKSVIEALGYKEPDVCTTMSATYVFKSLQRVSFRMLATLYDLSGFWAFY